MSSLLPSMDAAAAAAAAASRSLLEADGNRRPEWDILLIACQKNQPAKIRQLLERKDDTISPNHANSIQQSALHVAALWSHYECLQILLEAGAIVNRANTISGATPLHACVQSTKAYSAASSSTAAAAASGNVVCVAVDEEHKQQQQQARKLACVQLLLEYGADPQWTDFQGQTALDYWDERYDPIELKELLTTLLQHQAGDVPELFAALDELHQMGTDATSDDTTKNQLDSLYQRISNLVNDTTTTTILQTRHEGLTPLLQLIADICDRPPPPDNNDSDDDIDNYYNKYQCQILQVQVNLLQEMLTKDASPNDLPLTTTTKTNPSQSSVPTNNTNNNIGGMFGGMNTTMPKSSSSTNNDDDDVDYSLSAIHQVCQALVEEATHPTTHSAVFPPVATKLMTPKSSSDGGTAVAVGNAESSTTTIMTPTEPFQNCSCRFQLLWNVAHALMSHGATVPDMTHDFIHVIARGRNMKHRDEEKDDGDIIVWYLTHFWLSTLNTLPNHTNRQGMTPLQFAARSGKLGFVQFMLQTVPIMMVSAAAETAAAADITTSFSNNHNGSQIHLFLNPCQADQRGQTALDAAKVNGHDDIVELLQSYYPCSSSSSSST